jgi:hypothetical protein
VKEMPVSGGATEAIQPLALISKPTRKLPLIFRDTDSLSLASCPNMSSILALIQAGCSSLIVSGVKPCSTENDGSRQGGIR